MKLAPWRFLARPRPDGLAIGVLHDGAESVEGAGSIDAGAGVKQVRAAAFASILDAWYFLFGPADLRDILGVGENVAFLRIAGNATPVGAAGCAGEDERGLRRCALGVIQKRRERARVVKAARMVIQLFAGLGMLGCGVFRP